MYTLVLFQILTWNQIIEVESTGRFESREECQLTMQIAAKILERQDQGIKYFLLCKKV